MATIKPTDAGPRAFRYQMQPGGRLVAEGTPLQFLISRAFNSNNNEQIAGIPGAFLSVPVMAVLRMIYSRLERARARQEIAGEQTASLAK